MITFRISSRFKVCKDLMIKYNRQDLFPLLYYYPYWDSVAREAIWYRKYNCYNDNTVGYHTIPNEIFDLMKANKYVAAWGKKHYHSFDTALIAYTKALKKYIRTNKI